MTSEDSKRLDDVEFEAFLQGHGELARQLQGLPQPSPSAALDAAILAQAETLLKTATPPQAANDALSGKPGKPAKPRFLMRWSTQLGMAACMVLAVLATLRWQAEPATPSYDTAPPAEPAPPPPAAASAESLGPVEKKAQAKPELARPKTAVRSTPPAAKAAADAQPPAQAQDTQAAAAPTPAPAPFASRENYAASPPQLAGPENVPARTRAIIAPRAPLAANPPSAIAEPAATYSPAPAPIVAPPAYAPAPAPVIASGASATAAPTESESAPAAALSKKAESPARAEAWLSAIDEMLKAGLRQDALEEWDKFKRAYPDYPVPEKLRAQIKLLQK